jgi:hypothetical protein
MNGRKPLEAIVEAIRRHHRRRPDHKPSKIELHWNFAYDIAKLGRSELGELSEQIWQDGSSALEKKGCSALK